MYRKNLIACATLALLMGLSRQAGAQTVRGMASRGMSLSNPAGVATTGFTFSPPAGTYTGTQNVTVTYNPSSAGQSIFYTKDGTPVSAASNLFNGSPIPLTSPGTYTLNVLVESVGSVRQNTGSTVTGHKLCAPIYQNNPPGNTAYMNGTPAATCGGGVGAAQPSTWTVSTDGTTMFYSVTGTSGAPQILVTLGGSGCDSCTNEAQHFKLQPVANTHMENIEADMWHNDATRNRLHMFGLQCNQQSAFLQWQIDNEQGSWVNTGVTDHCPMTAGTYVDVVLVGHWTIGDTGCGGLGCTVFDKLIVNGVVHALGVSLENDNPGWAAGCASQKQLDLRSGGTPTAPFVASENVQQDNVTCSFGTVATGSAAFIVN